MKFENTKAQATTRSGLAGLGYRELGVERDPRRTAILGFIQEEVDGMLAFGCDYIVLRRLSGLVVH